MTTAKRNILIATGVLAAAFGLEAALPRWLSSRYLPIDDVYASRVVDLRESFPNDPPENVTGVELTFSGSKGSKTLQYPCNVFLNESIHYAAVDTPRFFGMKLTPGAEKEAKHLLIQTQNGVCGWALHPTARWGHP